ncbi:unnamed protein product [Ilex paraguariensis]|uniref:MBD domain-containing protein n=1 Tax=Ilex paraguariensis TaxID=185542 RepID=A0ABC8UWA2_9AQUA
MDTQMTSQLTLSERQEGWLVETRKRLNGRFDKFYYHEKTKKMFRSFAEVERFIKNGQYPQRKQHSEDQKPQDQSTSAFLPLEYEVSPNVSLKRKTETLSFDGSSRILKGNDFSASSSSSKQPMETIAKLLAGAYNNLLNFFSEKKDTKSSVPEINCEEQDNQMIQNMIEELMDEGNNFPLVNEEPMAPQGT